MTVLLNKITHNQLIQNFHILMKKVYFDVFLVKNDLKFL